MPENGDAERITVLRRTIARIEQHAPCRPDGARAGRVALGCPPSGDDDSLGGGSLGDGPGGGLRLDRLLGGGLFRGSLSEVVAAEARDAGAASGFALALAARFSAGGARPVVWILEDGARTETGMPYAPGLLAHGLDPARLVVVRAGGAAASLWAMEEALRCRGVAAAVLDLWRCRSYDLVASRRLVLAAAASGTPGILVPAGSPGAAARLATAAAVRFEVAAAPGLHVPTHAFPPALGPPPLPGRAAWSVRLARVRAGPAGVARDVDRDSFSSLVWDHHKAWFRDAHPVPPPAVLRHRPDPAARGGLRRAM